MKLLILRAVLVAISMVTFSCASPEKKVLKFLDKYLKMQPAQ